MKGKKKTDEQTKQKYCRPGQSLFEAAKRQPAKGRQTRQKLQAEQAHEAGGLTAS